MSTSAVRLTGALDPREAWKAERCTIAKSLEIVSTRSALLILREAFYGTTRFDDFAERVGISEPVTAARLRELVDEGLLERERGEVVRMVGLGDQPVDRRMQFTPRVAVVDAG